MTPGDLGTGRAGLREELVDLGATPAEGDRLVADLAGLLDLADAAPTPSADLARLLGTAEPSRAEAVTPIDAGARRRSVRRSGAVSGVLVLAVSGVGATGLSAAANTLPAPFQEQVSQLSRSYLPFEFPSPSRLDEARPEGREHPRRHAARPEGSDGSDGSGEQDTSVALGEAPGEPPDQSGGATADAPVGVDLGAPGVVVRPEVAPSRADAEVTPRPGRGDRPRRTDRPTRAEEPTGATQQPPPQDAATQVRPRAWGPAGWQAAAPSATEVAASEESPSETAVPVVRPRHGWTTMLSLPADPEPSAEAATVAPEQSDVTPRSVVEKHAPEPSPTTPEPAESPVPPVSPEVPDSTEAAEPDPGGTHERPVADTAAEPTTEPAVEPAGDDHDPTAD